MIILPLLVLIQTASPPPTQAGVDAAVMSYLSNSLKDPASATIQRHGEAQEGNYYTGGGLLTGKRVEHRAIFGCYRVNAKNSYGGYTGVKDFAFRLEDGRVTQVRSSPYYNEYAHREMIDDDVSRVCAGGETVTLQAAGSQQLAPTPSPAQELDRFAALRDRGLITAEEFEAKKRAILADGPPKP